MEDFPMYMRCALAFFLASVLILALVSWLDGRQAGGGGGSELEYYRKNHKPYSPAPERTIKVRGQRGSYYQAEKSGRKQ